MAPSNEDIEAQLEELVAKVREDQDVLQKAVEASRPKPTPAEVVIESPGQEMVPAVSQPEQTAVAKPQESGNVSNAILGKTPGEKARTIAAAGVGIAIGISFSSIIYGGAIAAAGYGVYRFVRWRNNKRVDTGEEIIDTTAEIQP